MALESLILSLGQPNSSQFTFCLFHAPGFLSKRELRLQNERNSPKHNFVPGHPPERTRKQINIHALTALTSQHDPFLYWPRLNQTFMNL